MAITRAGVNAAVRNTNLELLQEDRDSLAAMFVTLERTGQNQCSGHSRSEFSKKLGGLFAVHGIVWLSSLANKLETGFDLLPSLSTGASTTFIPMASPTGR
jgi:hypothetical protein